MTGYVNKEQEEARLDRYNMNRLVSPFKEGDYISNVCRAFKEGRIPEEGVRFCLEETGLYDPMSESSRKSVDNLIFKMQLERGADSFKEKARQ